MKKAVIATGGKQYVVVEGETITVERLKDAGKSVKFDALLTIDGDKAHITVLKDGLNTPTAVEPAGDVLWIAERGTGKAVSIPAPK